MKLVSLNFMVKSAILAYNSDKQIEMGLAVN